MTRREPDWEDMAMRRWLPLGLVLASCSVCVATAALWVRSYFAADSVWYNPPGYINELLTSNGGLEWYRSKLEGNQSFISPAEVGRRSAAPVDMGPGLPSIPGGWYRFGFGYGHSVGLRGETLILVMPVWVFLLPSAAASILFAKWWWQQVRRNRWSRQGRCVRCGYDLRATPGHCPECGAMTSTSVASV